MIERPLKPPSLAQPPQQAQLSTLLCLKAALTIPWLIALIWLAPVRATFAQEMPRRGGILKLAIGDDWRSVDPAVGFDIACMAIQRILYQQLLDYDDGNNLIPADAAEWSISNDQRTYTFKLRSDLFFAHGRQVEAEDYRYSLERLFDPKVSSPGPTYFRGVVGAAELASGATNHLRGVRVLSKDTLSIELEKPDFTFRYVMAMPFASVLPRELASAKDDSFTTRPLGSGPYCIKKWEKNVRYQIERNPFYARTNPAYIDGIDLMIGGDRSLHTMMFERGELDFVVDPPSADLIRLSRGTKFRDCITNIPMAAVDYLAMNVEMKPFDDVRVRRAVNHAINRKRIAVLAGSGFEAAYTVLPPTMPGFDRNPERYEYDPAKARVLLKEAGYPDGFKVELWSNQLPRFLRSVQSIQEDLRQVGIEVMLRPLQTAAFENTVQTRKRVSMAYWGWIQDYPDPSNFLDVLFNGDRITGENCNNIAFYSNPAVTRVLNEANAHNELDRRLELFHQAEQMILRDAPWVPTIYAIQPALCQKWIRGFRPHPVWLVRFDRFWFKR